MNMRRASKFCGLITAAILVGVGIGSTTAVATPNIGMNMNRTVNMGVGELGNKNNLVFLSEKSVHNDTADAVWDEVKKYIVVKDGVRYFDELAAQKASASKEVIEAGRIFNQMVANEDSGYRAVRLPVWGNWCGPGYGGENGGPVDRLDTACMHHDLCYEAQGYFSCDCDQKLIDEIDEQWDQMKAKEKVAAVGTKGFFTVGKLWCKRYPQIQKDAFRLEIKQNAWVVARYQISWDEETVGPEGKPVLKHHTWRYNDRDRTIRGIDIVDLPSNAKNLNLKININTGLAWKPWKTVFEAKDLEIVKHRSIELKGTVFRQWVLNNINN